ncbi:MAG TPA: hypothetical protein VFL82_11900 [Thermomicrobiales bacterium]|nr:hypothetical protein [Thermomicrobiales bacterium]
MASKSKDTEKTKTPENATKEETKFIHDHADELSSSVQSAKWIHSPDEHEDRPGQTLVTQSHNVIKAWAEERNATPATVEGTEHNGQPGVLRLNFPDYGGHDLMKINWDTWFKPFDDRQLLFIFQQHKRDGDMSNFFRLDNPNRDDG